MALGYCYPATHQKIEYARLKAACVRGIVGTIAIRNIGSKETSDDKDHMTNPKVENAQYSEEDIAKYKSILLTRNRSKQLEISRKAVLGQFDLTLKPVTNSNLQTAANLLYFARE